MSERSEEQFARPVAELAAAVHGVVMVGLGGSRWLTVEGRRVDLHRAVREIRAALEAASGPRPGRDG